MINKEIKIDEAVGLGRNCCVFHTVRKWAYVEIRKFRGKTYNQWLDAVVAECSKVNNQFTLPMNHNEMKGIAKSIARWVWKRDPHCYAMFIERQSMKGKKSKRGAKPDSARSMKPWEELGLSRATYYRHKKNETK